MKYLSALFLTYVFAINSFAQEVPTKISCALTFTELNLKLPNDSKYSINVVFEIKSIASNVEINSVASKTAIIFGSRTFKDKSGKTQSVKQFNNSDTNKWSLMEIRHEPRNGEWFNQMIEIDRNTGSFSFTQMSFNGSVEGLGSCEKVNLNSKKF
jgi:hypothetical protein